VLKESAYHHGNLKTELLNAALKLISETGSQAFTLREVARRAGVSQMRRTAISVIKMTYLALWRPRGSAN